jgi:hypothetical protein
MDQRLLSLEEIPAFMLRKLLINGYFLDHDCIDNPSQPAVFNNTYFYLRMLENSNLEFEENYFTVQMSVKETFDRWANSVDIVFDTHLPNEFVCENVIMDYIQRKLEDANYIIEKLGTGLFNNGYFQISM